MKDDDYSKIGTFNGDDADAFKNRGEGGVRNDPHGKSYFRYGLFIRSFKSPEILIAGFKFPNHAHEYGKTFPKGTTTRVRWIGVGPAPLEEGVTDNPSYL